jgi:steroid delta-isomerase-like uncharacterized protein
MTAEDSKKLIESWIASHEKRDIEAIRSLLDPSVTFNNPGQDKPLVGFDAYRASIEQVWTSFPNFQSKIIELIAAESRVVVRFADHFTHTGEFFGLQPSGRDVIHEGCTVFHLTDRISEVFTYVDHAQVQGQLNGGKIRYAATAVQYAAVPA